MKIIERLEVSSNEFFNALKEALISDAKENANLELNENDIKSGLEYEKELKTQLGKENKVRVSLLDFEDKKLYRARLDSSHGNNIVAYEILEEDENGISVSYFEDYVSEKKLNSLNYKLMDFLMTRSSKKKAIASLRGIEHYIINNRK